MSKLENLETVLRQLRDKKGRYLPKSATPKIVLGYGADYAVPVHENLEARHEPPTQAKFLEQPARLNQKKYAETIHKSIKSGKSVADALMDGATQLATDSVEICPIDKGNLRASIFVNVEEP